MLYSGSGRHKAGVATDLGVYDEYTVEHLFGSEILVLEANHDISMLEAGSYPYQLKRRILGEKGIYQMKILDVFCAGCLEVV